MHHRKARIDALQKAADKIVNDERMTPIALNVANAIRAADDVAEVFAAY